MLQRFFCKHNPGLSLSIILSYAAKAPRQSSTPLFDSISWLNAISLRKDAVKLPPERWRMALRLTATLESYIDRSGVCYGATSTSEQPIALYNA